MEHSRVDQLWHVLSGHPSLDADPRTCVLPMLEAKRCAAHNALHADTPIPAGPPPFLAPPFLRWRNVAAARKFACLDNGDVSR